MHPLTIILYSSRRLFAGLFADHVLGIPVRVGWPDPCLVWGRCLGLQTLGFPRLFLLFVPLNRRSVVSNALRLVVVQLQGFGLQNQGA